MKKDLIAQINPDTITVNKLELSENLVYLMGASFILGSLFAIFILVVLDFMQRDRIKK